MPDWDYVAIAQIVTAVATIVIPFAFAGAAERAEHRLFGEAARG